MSKVIDLIAAIEAAPRTQKEMAQLAGLHPRSVTRLLKDLEAVGLVRPCGFREKRYPAMLWRWK